MWVAGVILTAAMLAASASSGSEAPKARFRLLFLRQGWSSLGYEQKAALEKLRSARREDPLWTLTSGDIEFYDWATQSIRLTREASRRLAGALPSAEERKEAIWELGQKKRQGWGNAVERGLHHLQFVVLLGDEWLYGGIVLDPPSQMAIHYPVIRCSIESGQVVLRLLPMQLPFFESDPVVESGAPASSERRAESFSDVPHELKESLARAARSDEAQAMRALIHNPRIRKDLERDRKVQESPPPD